MSLLVMDGGVSKEVNSTFYQSTVGSWLYAAMATQPDITQSVGAVNFKIQFKPIRSSSNSSKKSFSLFDLFVVSETGRRIIIGTF